MRKEKIMADEEKGTEQKTGDADQLKAAVETTEDAAKKEEEGMKQAYLAEKEKRQQLEAQVGLLQDQMTLISANQPQQTQTAKAPSSAYEQAVAELGLQGQQWLDETQRAQIEARREQIITEQNSRRYNQMSANQFIASHADYAEAVGTTNPATGQFVPSRELMEILRDEPYLRSSLTSPENAYQIVMRHRQRVKRDKEYAAMKEHQGQQELDNKINPMSPSSVGGGTSGEAGGPLNVNSTFDDVAEIERRVKAGQYG
jgi:hypothetical protein